MKEKFWQPLIKAILAGVCISLGGAIYLSTPNNIVGAIFFGFALFMILNYDYNLYTGKVGYLFNHNLSYLGFLGTVLLGNLIGTVLCGLLLRLTNLTEIKSYAEIMAASKLDNDLLSVFLLSFFCGILMYIAVDFYKTKNNNFIKTVMIFLAVPIFILCKFEHSVANMFYFTIGNAWCAKCILYLLVMIIGNAVGAIFFNFLNQFVQDNENNQVLDN